MTFKEALCIPSDLNSSREEYRDEYKMIIEALGYEEVKRCIPFTIEKLKEAYKEDDFFNNLPLKKWDKAAGYDTGWHGEMVNFVGSELTKLYREKLRVDIFSCAEGVCILKNCAKMWVEEEEKRNGCH